MGAVTLRFKPALYTRLHEGARDKGVSLTVWVRAILLDFTGVYPGLTHQSASLIKAEMKKET